MSRFPSIILFKKITHEIRAAVAQRGCSLVQEERGATREAQGQNVVCLSQTVLVTNTIEGTNKKILTPLVTVKTGAMF